MSEEGRFTASVVFVGELPELGWRECREAMARIVEYISVKNVRNKRNVEETDI